MAKISDTQIANRNFLAPVGFKFSLAKYPKVSFFSNTARIPDISLGTVPLPSLFGSAVLNSNTFGAGEHPTVRTALTGSGHSNFFRIYSDDTNPPYIINGLYINYRPSGRL